mgnify:FL=1
MGRPTVVRLRHKKSGRFTGAVPTPRCPKTGKYMKNSTLVLPKKEVTIVKPK